MGAKSYPQIACYVTPEQHKALKALAARRGVAITVLLREAVDGLLKPGAGNITDDQQVTAAKASVPEGARERFDKALHRAVELETRRLTARFWDEIHAKVKEIVVTREESLREREQKLEEQRKKLADKERDITTYMSEAEFKRVLACLHPDRPDRSVEQLNEAFKIFNRLTDYIVRMPPTVMRARGWDAATARKKK
jgi:hypothetical protein